MVHPRFFRETAKSHRARLFLLVAFAWILAAAAPAAAVVPDTSIDSGPSDPTSDDTPEFTFSSTEPGSTFECDLDGGGFVPCSSPHELTPALGDGAHTFQVVATDPFLDVDPTPASATFVVDTTRPNTSITASPPAFSNDTNPVFEFSGSDPGGSGVGGFECRLDGGSWNPCSSGDAFPAPEGDHTFRVRAIDNAGNRDNSPATYDWMVDITKPTITVNVPAIKQHFLLHEGSPDYFCEDPLSGGPPPVASGVDSCEYDSWSNDIPLGPRLITFTAEDRAGNQADPVTRAYVIDPRDYGEFIEDSGPLAYYRLDEPLGSPDMFDASGNGHDGVYQNGVALERDGATACERRPHPPRACELDHPAENTAAWFGPRDDHGYVNGITAPTTAYTIEAWIRPETGADMSIAGHGGGGQLFISGGRLAFRQTQDTIYGGGPTLSPGAWWHVAATWNGSTSRLYVNGEQVGSSGGANKPPSGAATFYVGYGEMAPWFHGDLDEVAYYDRALSQHAMRDRYAIGTAVDHPSLGVGELNTAGPNVIVGHPNNDGLYAPTKVPDAGFECTDPDGPADILSCEATVDGTPISSGDQLPNGPGVHTFELTAEDLHGNVYVHTHTYRVMDFGPIHLYDGPVAYYRLGDATDAPMSDASGNGHHGTYKNGQQSGPVGISGDGDHARSFTGPDGYGYVNGIPAPTFQSSLIAWVNAEGSDDASIAGHGDSGELFIRGGTYRYRHMGEIVNSGVHVVPGQWTQVAGTWDGVKIRIYIDGEKAGAREQSIRPSSISTFYVGYGELEPWFRGAIDEVSYFDRAIGPDRMFQFWLADPPPGALTPVGAGSGSGGSGGGPGGSAGGGNTNGSGGNPGATPSDPADNGPAANTAACDKAKKGLKKAKNKLKKAKKKGKAKAEKKARKKLRKARSAKATAC